MAAASAWRGDHSLRLHYNIDRTSPPYGAFALVGIQLASWSGLSAACLANVPALDLTLFETVSMRVRGGDALADAEIALKALATSAEGADGQASPAALETDPKVLLSHAGRPRQGEWTEVRIPVCDLLHSGASSLQRSAVVELLIGVARGSFEEAGSYLPGTRYLDLDDITFIACEPAGCPPCP